MKNLPNLRFRILTVLLSASLLPLILLTIGAWLVFGRLLEDKSLEMQRSVVENHARAIDAYLEEKINSLKVLATIHDLKDIANQNFLSRAFKSLNEASEGGFQDIGIIDSKGNHLAYVGPYDLIDRNYYKEEWFNQVMDKGEYISDVFLGFRKVPHCIIAIKSENHGDPWILRATIDSEKFNSLVRTGILGETGDAFIVNSEGIYQTDSESGKILTPSQFVPVGHFQGTESRKIMSEGTLKIRMITWLNKTDWVLVILQDAAEVWAPVNRAITKGSAVVLIAMILIIITTFVATNHLTSRIRIANEQREEMHRAFTRSAKLASVGELATGLAHEINNPLAIISSDRTNIQDLIKDVALESDVKKELYESLERFKAQLERCKNITTKMLQFGRKREVNLESIQVNSFLTDIVNMLQRQAGVLNVKMTCEIEEGLPFVLIDPMEFEQVIVNLINNSFQALPNGGNIIIKTKCEDSEVILEVRDDGCGILPEIIDRIFEPFFTTKPVGQGTGLGLSVCYGVVESWKGKIEAESAPGKGTTMRIRIPVYK